MYKNNVNSASLLTEDIDANLETLDYQGKEREFFRIELTYNRIIESVASKEKELTQAQTQCKRCDKRKREIIAKEIVRAAEGCLKTPYYRSKSKDDQIVFLFTGTHWETMEGQQFKDFVNKASQRCGIDESDLHDPDFMVNLYDQVAFMVAEHIKVFIPDGETWINVKNGTLVIKRDGTVVLRKHKREDFFHYTLDYNYDKNATCPLWHKFLDKMLPDADVQKMLASYIGYCFTNGIKLEKMLVLYGKGANGKSVVLETMEGIFGSCNVSNINLADLTNDPEKRLHIENKLVNISYESNKAIEPSILKQLVSGEPIDARRLYVGTIKINRYAKLATAFNILPKAEATRGFYRRFIIMPFSVTISDKEADVDLPKKLYAERPGILNWILEALIELLKTKELPKCEVCDKALSDYKLKSDSALSFIYETCAASTEEISAKELYEKYKSYCYAEGFRQANRRNFIERIEAMGYKSTLRHKMKYFNITINDYD